MKEELIIEMKKSIYEVVNGEEKLVSLVGVYPINVTEYIQELGGEEIEDLFESNGWQWDFWQKFSLNDEAYMCAGSGYYGNLTFSKQT